MVLQVNENTIGVKPIFGHLILGLLPRICIVKPNAWLAPVPNGALVLVLVCDSKGVLRT